MALRPEARRLIRARAHALAMAVAAVMISAAPARQARAHQGPPFPIVLDRAAGRYTISVWTDPDVTDDRTAAGKFWIVVDPAGPADAATQVRLLVRPTDGGGGARPDEARAVQARLVAGKPGQFSAAVELDHEGRWALRAFVHGPRGDADVAAPFDATYDQRPAPVLTLVFVAPFLGAGLLWVKASGRRRTARRHC